MIMEKRNVYLTEFEKMSFKHRYAYVLYNSMIGGRKPETNPLKWSIASLSHLVLWCLIGAIIPVSSVVTAARLKTAYKERGEGWFISNVWVVKK